MGQVEAGGRRMDFVSRILSSLFAALIAALVLGLIAKVWLKDDIYQWLVQRDPTCSEPAGLTPVDPVGVSEPKTDSSPPSGVEGGASPRDAFDGYLGSWWVPHLESPRVDVNDRHTWHVARLAKDPESRTLIVTLPDELEVRLVCVVSGLPESETRYRMHGSVKDLTVWGADAIDDVSQSTLQRLGPQRMNYFQDAGGEAIGSTSTVQIRVDSVFSGETVEAFDPDDCLLGEGAAEYRMETLADLETPQQRYGPGCIRAPVPAAGLAEIMIYVRR